MVTSDQRKKLEQLFPVLDRLPASVRQALYDSGQIIELPPSQMLMQQNQQCQFIPLVMKGTLRVYKLSPNGREMTLYRVGAGDTCLVSIACHLRGEDFPALAQVEERTTLFMVPTALYNDVLDRQPVWKDFLIMTMYDHLVETMETLEAVTFDRTDHRLALWLLTRTEHGPGLIHTTHEAIAVELGTVREVVSRLLGELKSQGAVDLSRGKIKIIKPGILEEMLEV